MSLLMKLCPDERRPNLSGVDVAALRERGFEAAILDLDNTLLPWQSTAIPDSSRRWVENAKELGMKLCILSNTHYPKRLRRIAEELGVSCLDRALKPRKSGFAKAAGLLGSDPTRTVVIGDQVLTDILGGNLAGMHTILVKPMARREFIGTKISRLMEKVVLAVLRKTGLLPGYGPGSK